MVSSNIRVCYPAPTLRLYLIRNLLFYGLNLLKYLLLHDFFHEKPLLILHSYNSLGLFLSLGISAVGWCNSQST